MAKYFMGKCGSNIFEITETQVPAFVPSAVAGEYRFNVCYFIVFGQSGLAALLWKADTALFTLALMLAKLIKKQSRV